MNGKCHHFIGTIAGITACASTVQNQHPIMIGTCVLAGAFAGGIGGLLPDIDKRNSTISKKAKITSYVAEKVAGHRGVLHTPVITILICMGLLYITSKYNVQNIFVKSLIYAFVAGYGSHILADFLTPKGIMLAYPLSTKHVHILGLKGKFGEKFVEVLTIIICLLILINIFFNINVVKILWEFVLVFSKKTLNGINIGM